MNDNIVTDPVFLPPLRLLECDMFRDGGTVYVSVLDGNDVRHDLFFDKEFHRPYYGSVHPSEKQHCIRYLDLHGKFTLHLEMALAESSADRAPQASEWIAFFKAYPQIVSKSSAQQGDAPEPATNASPPSRPPSAPAR